MARKHGGNVNGGTMAAVKLGHRVTVPAASVLGLMASLRGLSEAEILEGSIRLAYDHLPASQRDAIAAMLRAKGQSIRDLRPLPGMVETIDPAVPGQGRADDPAPTVRINGVTNRIGEIARKAAAPVDNVLETLGQD